MTDEAPSIEYGDPTHHARSTDPDTSHAAAWLNPGRRGTQRYRLAVQFTLVYPGDLNWDEAAARAEIPAKSSPWRRLTELHERGIIERTGTRITSSGAQATTYRITEEGWQSVWAAHQEAANG